MPCPNCTVTDVEIERISKKRASRTAHVLAMKECEKNPDPRFNYVDVYTTMFRRIYEHEYKRNMFVERERRTYNIRMSRTQWNDVCSYHAEFDDDFCEEVMKKVEQEYAKSKWPNKLPAWVYTTCTPY